MRLIPRAADEFFPKRQCGGDVIEVNKLISKLQDNVQSRVLDAAPSAALWAEREASGRAAELLISLGGNPCFIRQFNTIKPIFFCRCFDV